MQKKITLTKFSIAGHTKIDNSKIFNTLWSFVLLFSLFVTGCKKDNYKGAVQGVCPVVISTTPMDKSVDANSSNAILVTFNTAMKPSSIDTSTFLIQSGIASGNGAVITSVVRFKGLSGRTASAVNGSTTVSGKIAPTSNPAIFSFTPTTALLPFTTYTGTITTGAKDTFGTSLVNNYVWTFTTMPQITLAPSPVVGGTTTGSGNFAQGSVVTVTATPNAGYAFISWTNNGVVASTSSSYQFTINGNTALAANFVVVIPGKSTLNLSSAPVAGGTTSGSGLYNTGSAVTVAASPNNGYIFTNWTNNGVVVSTSSSYQFPLTGNTTLVANYKVISSSQLAVILSSSPAAGGTTTGSGAYTTGASVLVTATPNLGYSFLNWTKNGVIASTSANYTFPLSANTTLVANFTPNVAIGPGDVNLGSSVTYTILTLSGVSSTGTTSILGNIGVSPASSTSITGFGLIVNTNGQSAHTPIVTGSVFAADYATPTPANLTVAVSDMETAFTTANGLITPAPVVNLGAGDISGLTMQPGLYKWGTGVLITNAGVTLSGGPNDTWVFQISQDLTVNNSANITLLGGAQAKNVFWIVNGQATLGTNVNFSGNILSQTLISLNTGTTVTGRLFAQTAVTLNASTVVLP